MIRQALAVGAIGVALALLAGHAGALHPALDSFAHIRLQLLALAAAVALPCFAIGARNAGAILAAVAIGSFTLTVPFLLPPERGSGDPVAASFAPGYTLLQQNLSYRNPNQGAFLSRVASVEPDVITLQEAHRDHDPMIERLTHRYPYVHRCRGATAVGDVAILSRRAFAPDIRRRCTPGLAIIAVSLNGHALAVGSVHLRWPWPFGQGAHLESLAPHMAIIGAPGILAGDFNAVTWSAAANRLAGMMDGTLVRGIGGTRVAPRLPRWLRPLWDIPIDNAVVTDFVEVTAAQSIPLDGSDHDTVVVSFRLRLPPREPELLVLR